MIMQTVYYRAWSKAVFEHSLVSWFKQEYDFHVNYFLIWLLIKRFLFYIVFGEVPAKIFSRNISDAAAFQAKSLEPVQSWRQKLLKSGWNKKSCWYDLFGFGTK